MKFSLPPNIKTSKGPRISYETACNTCLALRKIIQKLMQSLYCFPTNQIALYLYRVGTPGCVTL